MSDTLTIGARVIVDAYEGELLGTYDGPSGYIAYDGSNMPAVRLDRTPDQRTLVAWSQVRAA